MPGRRPSPRVVPRPSGIPSRIGPRACCSRTPGNEVPSQGPQGALMRRAGKSLGPPSPGARKPLRTPTIRSNGDSGRSGLVRVRGDRYFGFCSGPRRTPTRNLIHDQIPQQHPQRPGVRRVPRRHPDFDLPVLNACEAIEPTRSQTLPRPRPRRVARGLFTGSGSPPRLRADGLTAPRCTAPRVQSPHPRRGHGTPPCGNGTPWRGHETPSCRHRTPSRGHRTPSCGHRTLSRGHRTLFVASRRRPRSHAQGHSIVRFP